MGRRNIPGYHYADIGECRAGDLVYTQPLYESGIPGGPVMLLAKLTLSQARRLKVSDATRRYGTDEIWACIDFDGQDMHTLYIGPSTFWMIRDD